VALLIVVSLLTVIGIMGVAFVFSMFLETRAARQFIAATQARYLAEAGVSAGRAWLDEDRLGSRTDEPDEAWVSVPAGADADVDGDGTVESRWWLVEDGAGETAGRYAVRITDEAGKANLNAGEAQPAASGPAGINLTTLLQAAGIGPAAEAAAAIEAYRYGPDTRPGVALVDDDGNGLVDDAAEYEPLALRGDDRRLEGLGELAAIAGLSREEIARLGRVATVYSWDLNVSVVGVLRANVNTSTATELVIALLEAGVEDPWQAAVNLADYVDADLALSLVTKASYVHDLVASGPLGSWDWAATPVGHYETDLAGGTPLTWSVEPTAGTYRIRARGVSGVPVGDVTIAGETRTGVEAGGYLGRFDVTGALVVSVAHHGAPGEACAFRGLELVPEEATGGSLVRGIEAVRINELMVEPVQEYPVSAADFEVQGSDWGCPVGGDTCTNSGVGQARWTWAAAGLRPGRYYVRVYGSAAGQTVGQVSVDGQSQLLVHGQTHTVPVLVGADGKFSLAIGKSEADGTYYMGRAALSQQPDGEYVELINLSDQPVDVSGWWVEGEAAGGRQAQLPAASVIPAHGLLVAVVDLDDGQEGLANNGIDARSAWEMAAEVVAVQLEFPEGAPSPSDDWLKVTMAEGTSPRLVLRQGAVSVDEVEYPLPLPVTTGFQSLEKGDPTVVVDDDADGLDEGWYPALRLYTPGAPNDNDGLVEIAEGEPLRHDPLAEVTVLNRLLGSVGELAGLPSGQAWRPFASADLAKVADRLTVEGLRLETEGHLIAGGDAWEDVSDGHAISGSGGEAVIGRWQWTDVPDGSYRLNFYGGTDEQVAIRWALAGDVMSAWSPTLSTDAQGRVAVGQVEVGMDEGVSRTLTIEVRCESPGGVCHAKHLALDPQLLRVGPVNVNTAPSEVLTALPGVTAAVAQRIIAGRPFGDQEDKGRGIGDLLVGDVLGAAEEDRLAIFRQVAHLVTTRSDVFEILSLGQSLEESRVGATQRIQAVVQRQ
jgi:type II secretory pathway component PulK